MAALVRARSSLLLCYVYFLHTSLVDGLPPTSTVRVCICMAICAILKQEYRLALTTLGLVDHVTPFWRAARGASDLTEFVAFRCLIFQVKIRLILTYPTGSEHNQSLESGWGTI